MTIKLFILSSWSLCGKLTYIHCTYALWIWNIKKALVIVNMCWYICHYNCFETCQNQLSSGQINWGDVKSLGVEVRELIDNFSWWWGFSKWSTTVVLLLSPEILLLHVSLKATLIRSLLGFGNYLISLHSWCYLHCQLKMGKLSKLGLALNFFKREFRSWKSAVTIFLAA